MTQSELDFGRALRDAGIAATSAANRDWLGAAMNACLAERVPGAEFIGEDLRALCIARGVEPRAPQAWGALVRTLATRGLILDTGRSEQMRDGRSHARRSPVWRWV